MLQEPTEMQGQEGLNSQQHLKPCNANCFSHHSGRSLFAAWKEKLLGTSLTETIPVCPEACSAVTAERCRPKETADGCSHL